MLSIVSVFDQNSFVLLNEIFENPRLISKSPKNSHLHTKVEFISCTGRRGEDTS